MAYTTVSENTLYDFVENNKELINSVKLMSVSEPYGFNELEGYQADLRFKVDTIDGYRNKFLQITINSSYLNNDIDTFVKYAENCEIIANDCLL